MARHALAAPATDLGPAGVAGVLCGAHAQVLRAAELSIVPDRGLKMTYTHPQLWLPCFRPTGGDAALRTLVTRYLYAYGPATPQQFAKWLGIPPRYAAGLFGKLAGELERADTDGMPGWI